MAADDGDAELATVALEDALDGVALDDVALVEDGGSSLLLQPATANASATASPATRATVDPRATEQGARPTPTPNPAHVPAIVGALNARIVAGTATKSSVITRLPFTLRGPEGRWLILRHCGEASGPELVIKRCNGIAAKGSAYSISRCAHRDLDAMARDIKEAARRETGSGSGWIQEPGLASPRDEQPNSAADNPSRQVH